ncbi:MAG: CRISPR-associated primase-polymerase type A1 [Thermodesulfobacteriota bacterium]
MALARPDEHPDFGLLLRRLEEAVLGSDGRAALERALAGGPFWQNLTPPELVRFAGIGQAAGRPELALAALERANERQPDLAAAWRQRLEILALLDRGVEALAVKARAAAILGDEPVAAWLADLLPAAGALPPPPAPGLAEDPAAGDEAACRPFGGLRRPEARLAQYLELFQGREDAFARQWADRQRGEQGYAPVRRPLTLTDLEDHLAGRRTSGIYLLRADATVRSPVVDIDLAPACRRPDLDRAAREQVRREGSYLLTRLAELAREAGLFPIVELSGGKGFHLWLPVAEPVPAGQARAALLALVARVQGDVRCFQLEVFPKQDRHTGKGLGNLVKLPLGIHRATGRPSSFLKAAAAGIEAQLAFLAFCRPAPAAALTALATAAGQATVLVHPRLADWARQFPALAMLEERCALLAQIFASSRSGRALSLREEKVLLGTVGHLPDGRGSLHHLLAALPEYNRPLLDFKISRLRGTPLGCRRLHSLLDAGSDLPCRFPGRPDGYLHPLLHLPDWQQAAASPKAERVENLADAVEQLRSALACLERFLPPR